MRQSRFWFASAQSGLGYLASNAHVIKLGLECTKTRLDVTQAFAVSKLGEGHAKKLIKARKTADAEVPVIFDPRILKLVSRKVAIN
jgi:hypothetical protein